MALPSQDDHTIGLTLRVARPTDRLETIAAMYRKGLGLEELGSFHDHEGFDGVMLGRPDITWHLEFTHRRGHEAGGQPSPEHLLVVYEPDPDLWARTCHQMVSAGFQPVAALNPYWDRNGRTFVDVDGYRIVICRRGWPQPQAGRGMPKK